MKPHPRWLAFQLALFVLTLLLPAPSPAQAYVGRPKLIVIVVIDQFRGDYLNRDHAKFKGHGFRLFMDEGAWFTDCYYDYANTKTAPGHATIGTGAYTDGHGIESNEFWDASRSNDHKVSSVEDERYQLVDLPPSRSPPISLARPTTPRSSSSAPRRSICEPPPSATSCAWPPRAGPASTASRSRTAPRFCPPANPPTAPSGSTTPAASSPPPPTTWSTCPSGRAPSTPAAASPRPPAKPRSEGTTQFFDLVGRIPAANSYELDFAKALITGEKLGQSGVTDLVVVSLSANDIQGHQFGPDSDSEEQMILSLDHDLDSFYTWLDQAVGLKNVWLALTADHGIAPIPGDAAKLGIHSAQ